MGMPEDEALAFFDDELVEPFDDDVPLLLLAEDPEPFVDDDVELAEVPLIALCSAAERELLTRFNAVWLARLERPVARVVVA